MDKEKIEKRIKKNEEMIKSLQESDKLLDERYGYCPDSANKVIIRELQIENSELKRLL